MSARHNIAIGVTAGLALAMIAYSQDGKSGNSSPEHPPAANPHAAAHNQLLNLDGAKCTGFTVARHGGQLAVSVSVNKPGIEGGYVGYEIFGAGGNTTGYLKALHGTVAVPSDLGGMPDMIVSAIIPLPTHPLELSCGRQGVPTS
ncbi:MAG TPA: hypothetical protein VLH84_03975 [Patescibacteria group bacterium]|nr:hypothetical protein [Patescibacteria group bacterium]